MKNKICEHQWWKHNQGWICSNCKNQISENEFRMRMILHRIVNEYDSMKNESDNSELFDAIDEASDLLKYT